MMYDRDPRQRDPIDFEELLRNVEQLETPQDRENIISIPEIAVHASPEGLAAAKTPPSISLPEVGVHASHEGLAAARAPVDAKRLALAKLARANPEMKMKSSGPVRTPPSTQAQRPQRPPSDNRASRHQAALEEARGKQDKRARFAKILSALGIIGAMATRKSGGSGGMPFLAAKQLVGDPDQPVQRAKESIALEESQAAAQAKAAQEAEERQYNRQMADRELTHKETATANTAAYNQGSLQVQRDRAKSEAERAMAKIVAQKEAGELTAAQAAELRDPQSAMSRAFQDTYRARQHLLPPDQQMTDEQIAQQPAEALEAALKKLPNITKGRSRRVGGSGGGRKSAAIDPSVASVDDIPIEYRATIKSMMNRPGEQGLSLSEAVGSFNAANNKKLTTTARQLIKTAGSGASVSQEMRGQRDQERDVEQLGKDLQIRVAWKGDVNRILATIRKVNSQPGGNMKIRKALMGGELPEVLLRDPDVISLRSDIAAMKSQRFKQFAGANVTGSEKQRLNAALATEALASPANFIRRMREFRAEIGRHEKAARAKFDASTVKQYDKNVSRESGGGKRRAILRMDDRVKRKNLTPAQAKAAEAKGWKVEWQ